MTEGCAQGSEAPVAHRACHSGLTRPDRSPSAPWACENGRSNVEVVRDGEMPPWDYLIMHPEARLSDAAEQAFVDGLTRTFGGGESGEDAED